MTKVYTIKFAPTAIKDMLKLQKNEFLYEKMEELIKELKTHPRTGKGKQDRSMVAKH
jgi:Txe/YoeB family toxin of Txe-Axe toxin-antitoxin module